MVECHLAKVDVEGSNPFSRSNETTGPAQRRARFSLGRDKGFRTLTEAGRLDSLSGAGADPLVTPRLL